MVSRDKKVLLDKIEQDIISNKICPDLASQAQHLVMGDGNIDAEIVLIGEAPGRQEDEQGKPFVGASGKFLNEMLMAAGINRPDVYITNIVKYRPPGNRDPLPEEKRAFWPYLLRQLEIINPKIIVTLGRHSMEYFLRGSKISSVHGQPQLIHATADGKKYDWVIMPLFHPAAALYNGSLRQTLIDDFNKFPSVIKQVDAGTIDHRA